MPLTLCHQHPLVWAVGEHPHPTGLLCRDRGSETPSCSSPAVPEQHLPGSTEGWFEHPPPWQSRAPTSYTTLHGLVPVLEAVGAQDHPSTLPALQTPLLTERCLNIALCLRAQPGCHERRGWLQGRVQALPRCQPCQALPLQAGQLNSF